MSEGRRGRGSKANTLRGLKIDMEVDPRFAWAELKARYGMDVAVESPDNPKVNVFHDVAIRELASKSTFMIPRYKESLKLILEAELRKVRLRQLKRGKVDAGRIALLPTQLRDDIFCRPAYKADTDVAVTLVMDDSYSMRNSITSKSEKFEPVIASNYAGPSTSRADKSILLAYVFAEVLDGLRIPFEIVTGGWYRKMAYDGDWITFDRQHRTPMTVNFVKQFNKPWDQESKRNLCWTRGNTDGSMEPEVLAHAATRLSRRREERKLIFLLSDGMPVCGPWTSACRDVLVRLPVRYARAGVNVFGFGIGTEALHQLMDGWAETVSDLNQLNDVVFRRMARMMGRG